ncbi:MAG: hypothetical protein RL240_4456 [Planctomycetota bacterium]|jgi:hypothetical protein
MSMPASTAPVANIVLCDTLDPNIVSVIRSVGRKSRLQTLGFSGDSMWFFSGGAGLDPGQFEL